LKAAVALLKNKFVTDTASLLHGDLHTGSIMCTRTSTFVIDHEFAFYGPMGFDVGAFLANLLLAYFSQDGLEKRSPGGGDRSFNRAWLLGCVVTTWRVFEKGFTELWDARGVGEGDAGVTPGSVYAGENNKEALRAAQKRYVLGLS
jgi:5-methylthioribose kinase